MNIGIVMVLDYFFIPRSCTFRKDPLDARGATASIINRTTWFQKGLLSFKKIVCHFYAFLKSLT